MAKRIQFQSRISEAEIILPGSKSQSNRLLVLRALSAYEKSIEGLSTARDSRVLASLLDTVVQPGKGNIELNCLDGGAPLRFMIAVCSLLPGTYILRGSERLMQRPQEDLIFSLRKVGVPIRTLGVDGNGPWEIQGGHINTGEWEIATAISTQYASALLLIAPFYGKEVSIKLNGRGLSMPYLGMTLQALKQFGVNYKQNGDRIIIQPGTKPPAELVVEADWSSAAFFYAAASLLDMEELVLPNLLLPSIQGDSFLENLFRYEGLESECKDGRMILRKIPLTWQKKPLTLNLEKYPDLAPALVVYYLMQSREVDFYGLESLSIKESIRDEVIGDMVRSCGAEWEKGEAVWKLRGTITQKPTQLKTHYDHRMVMAFSLLSIHFGTVELEEIRSVEKSFPSFWQEMKKLGISENETIVNNS
ncbi:MAG: 3-phosphoshikimate 1-carboxyvinyltransferase [Bacteroidia bacterium]